VSRAIGSTRFFAAQQSDAPRQMIETQSEAMFAIAMIALFRERFVHLEREIALLEAERRDTHEVVVAPGQLRGTALPT
jgi:hypothetical protein